MLSAVLPIEVSEFCFVFPSVFRLDLPIWSFRILVFLCFPRGWSFGDWGHHDIILILSCHTCCSNVPFSATHDVSDERERERQSTGSMFLQLYETRLSMWVSIPPAGSLPLFQTPPARRGFRKNRNVCLQRIIACSILGSFRKNHSVWRSRDSREHGFNSSEKVKFKQTLTAASTSLTSDSKTIKSLHTTQLCMHRWIAAKVDISNCPPQMRTPRVDSSKGPAKETLWGSQKRTFLVG